MRYPGDKGSRRGGRGRGGVKRAMRTRKGGERKRTIEEEKEEDVRMKEELSEGNMKEINTVNKIYLAKRN